MQKPTGHLNLLDLTFAGNDVMMINILDLFKDNINALCLGNLDSEFQSFLLQENTRFEFLEKLSIFKENQIGENLLKKHSEQVIHLELQCGSDRFYFQNLSKLETLTVYDAGPDALVSLLASCSESLTKLIITNKVPNAFLKQVVVPKLSKLQSLVVIDCCEDRLDFFGEFVTTLLSECRQTLTEISLSNSTYNVQDTYFPKVKCLEFITVPGEHVNALISSHACVLESLSIWNIEDLIYPSALPKMKHVWITGCDEVPDLLKCAPLLQCLVLGDCSDLRGTPKMPCLTDLYLFGNELEEESISELLANNSETLEFLILNPTQCKVFERLPVELKKVHTVIINGNPLSRVRDCLKSLCPNAQIMTPNDGREYRIEALKSRFKYLKADYNFTVALFDYLKCDMHLLQ